jgi:osomolarity two-component system sensor histidine kinase NIK1
MPFMGGMEATELIRAYEMHKRLLWTPIIALTAHASTLQSQGLWMVLANRSFSDWRSRTMLAGRYERSHHQCVPQFPMHSSSLTDTYFAEPLRCGDLLNLINKLAGERAQLATQHHLFYRPSALMAP